MSAFTDEATPTLDGYYARARSAQSYEAAAQQLAAMGFTNKEHNINLLGLYDGDVTCVVNCLLHNSTPAPIAPPFTAARAQDSEAGVDYSADDLAVLFGSARL